VARGTVVTTLRLQFNSESTYGRGRYKNPADGPQTRLGRVLVVRDSCSLPVAPDATVLRACFRARIAADKYRGRLPALGEDRC